VISVIRCAFGRLQCGVVGGLASQSSGGGEGI